MNKKFVMLIAFAALLAWGVWQEANASDEFTLPDSLLSLVCPVDEGIYSNPDSVMYDIRAFNWDKNHWYAKKWFVVSFRTVSPFVTKLIPLDSAFHTDNFDTVNFNSVSNRFRELERIFGTITMYRSEIITCDSVFMEEPIIKFRFDKYYKQDTVVSFLEKIDSIAFALLATSAGFNGVEEIIHISDIKFAYNANSIRFEFANEKYLGEEILLYNLLGQLICVQKINNIIQIFDTSNLESGFYIMRIGVNTFKIIK